MRDNLKPLLYFVHERESIRLKKLEGIPLRESADGVPAWTDDPILSMYRFCNVRRRDDRVSKWLAENVLTEANIKYDLKSFLMFSALGRWSNWPPTLKAIMDAKLYPKKKIDWARVGKLIDQRGEVCKAWTGAFMIRAPGKGKKKGAFVAEIVLGENFKEALPGLVEYFKTTPPTERSYQVVHSMLKSISGYGSFMSGQIAGDWTYTSLLDKAYDLKTWAPMGPGSVRGFNRIMGNEKLSKKPTQELWQQKLVAWRAAIVKRMGNNYEDMDLLSVQNVCCEIDKYLRVKNGEGRPRAKYRPETAY